MLGPNAVDMAEPDGSVSPQSPVAAQLRGSKLEPLELIDLDQFVKIIASSEQNRDQAGQQRLIEELGRLSSHELQAIEEQIDQELQQSNFGPGKEEATSMEARSQHLKQLLKATNELRRGLRQETEDGAVGARP